MLAWRHQNGNIVEPRLEPRLEARVETCVETRVETVWKVWPIWCGKTRVENDRIFHIVFTAFFTSGFARIFTSVFTSSHGATKAADFAETLLWKPFFHRNSTGSYFSKEVTARPRLSTYAMVQARHPSQPNPPHSHLPSPFSRSTDLIRRIDEFNMILKSGLISQDELCRNECNNTMRSKRYLNIQLGRQAEASFIISSDWGWAPRAATMQT